MQIKRTTHYDQFKIIVANREVDKRHVKKLAQSIQKKNLLHIRPIICNNDMQIIDGQHRLAACQLIGQPVYYIQVDDLTKEDITVLNTAQKNWSMIDFINFYAIEGRPEYKQFTRLVNRFSGMKITMLLRLCGSSKNVRDGQIDISRIKNAERVCVWIEQLRNKGFAFVYERDFGLALAACIDREELFDRLFNRVQSDVFFKCNSKAEYIRMITKIIST
jgi:hypothetical protein